MREPSARYSIDGRNTTIAAKNPMIDPTTGSMTITVTTIAIAVIPATITLARNSR